MLIRELTEATLHQTPPDITNIYPVDEKTMTVMVGRTPLPLNKASGEITDDFITQNHPNGWDFKYVQANGKTYPALMSRKEFRVGPADFVAITGTANVMDEAKQKRVQLPLDDRSASDSFQTMLKKIEAGEIDPKNLPAEYKVQQDLVNMMIQTGLISNQYTSRDDVHQAIQRADSRSQSPVVPEINMHALAAFLAQNQDVAHKMRAAGLISEDDEPKRKKSEQPARAAEPDYKEPESDEIDWGTFLDEPESKPIAKAEPPKPEKDYTTAPEAPNLRKASKAATAAAVGRITPTDQMRDMLGRINVPDDMMRDEPEMPSDQEETRPEPVTPENLPSVINKTIAAHDPHAINPEWHQIRNLPGYMQRPIRALGRGVFSQFTDTPIEDISLVANLGGQGPNSDREVAGVAAWLKANAKRIDAADMDFGDTIPGYEAQTLVYKVPGMRFLVVRDFAGGYIYAWPDNSDDSLIGAKDQPLRLG